MSTLLQSEGFRRELPGWLVRGILCASASACWAALIGFRAPAEIAGMVAGVACWVGIFTALCIWNPSLAWLKQPQLSSALKRAALIKLGLGVLGWLCFAGSFSRYRCVFQWLGVFGTIDLGLGIATLLLVAQIGSFQCPEQISQLDSFVWTALTTVVQGALMALLIGLIALAVVGWWRLKAKLAVKNALSPSRYPG